jgi:secretion/DNA translocation related CpaE-like protein
MRRDRPGSSVVLVASADDALLDDLLRLTAVARVEPFVAHDVASLRRSWSTARLVVLGDDLAAGLGRAPVRRDHVLLVARHGDRSVLNERAVLVGAEDVVVLPQSQEWLVDQMAAAAEGPSTGAVAAVLGCRGGAGASTFVAVLAHQAARAGLSCVAVDCDPLGADLDTLLDTGEQPGLRWPDLAQSRGRLPAEALAAALPLRGGVCLLSGQRRGRDAAMDGPGLEDEALMPVVQALSRAFDLVIADVPRWMPGRTRAVVEMSDVVLLVTTADPRGAASAARMATSLGAITPTAQLLVRTGRSWPADPHELADLVDLGLAGELRHDRRLASGGHGLDANVGRGLRRAARLVLSDLATGQQRRSGRAGR